jgi:putative transposase
LFYHVVWATKGREVLIDENAAKVIERSIKTGSRDLGGIVHAFGWMPEHVHLAVSIPPNTGIATFIGRLKGGSSHAVNDVLVRDVTFAWQGEYGVVSFGEKNLPDVVAYIQNQRERHAAQRLWDSLEQVTDRPQEPSDDGP